MTIYGVGRNYAAHAREMGAGAEPEGETVVFLKPSTALLSPPGPVRFPPGAGEIHHEVEIVVRVGAGAGAAAVAVGLDLTDRTRQAEAKRRGLPWARAKGFRGSACVGPFVPITPGEPFPMLAFGLDRNGRPAQRGNTRDMLRPVEALLRELVDWFGLAPGDLVFTGTPEGVGPIAAGDRLDLWIEGIPSASARFEVAG